MARNDQVSRILRIIGILELAKDGLRIPELLSKLNNEDFDCSRRTLYRDLDAIQLAGFPVENSESGEDSGVWKLSATARVHPKVAITYQELLSLFLCREAFRAYEGTAI